MTATTKKIASMAQKLALRLDDRDVLKAADAKVPGAGALFADTRPLVHKLADPNLTPTELVAVKKPFQSMVKDLGDLIDAVGGGDPSCAQRCSDELRACAHAIDPNAPLENQVADAVLCALTFEVCDLDCLVPG